MKILIGTPLAVAQTTMAYTLSLWRLGQWFARHRSDVVLEPLLVTGAQVGPSRAVMASRVLADDSFTHLLFIDSDIGFRPEAVARLLDCGHAFCGSFYPAKRAGTPQSFVGTGAIVRLDNGGFQVVNGFARATQLGMGFTLLERTVLERLAAAYPQLLADADPWYRSLGVARVFQAFESLQDEATGLFLGEDLAFCRRWTALGGEIWSLVDEPVTHVGLHSFSGSYLDSLKPG